MRKITYLVDYNNIAVERLTGDHAELAQKIHPERCFDKGMQAKRALIDFYKAIRKDADDNVKKAHLVTWSTIKPHNHE